MFDIFKSRFLKFFTRFHDMFREGSIPQVVKDNSRNIEKDLEKFKETDKQIRKYFEEYLKIRESALETTQNLISEAKRNNYSHFNENLFRDLIRHAQNADSVFEQITKLHKK